MYAQKVGTHLPVCPARTRRANLQPAAHPQKGIQIYPPMGVQAVPLWLVPILAVRLTRAQRYDRFSTYGFYGSGEQQSRRR